MCCTPVQNCIAIRLRLLQRGHVTALGEDQQVAVSHPWRDLVRLRRAADQIERTTDDQRRALNSTQKRSQIAPLVESAFPHLDRSQIHFEHRSGFSCTGLAHIGTVGISRVEQKPLASISLISPRARPGKRTSCPIIPDLASFRIPFCMCMSC